MTWDQAGGARVCPCKEHGEREKEREREGEKRGERERITLLSCAEGLRLKRHTAASFKPGCGSVSCLRPVQTHRALDAYTGTFRTPVTNYTMLFVILTIFVSQS